MNCISVFIFILHRCTSDSWFRNYGKRIKFGFYISSKRFTFSELWLGNLFIECKLNFKTTLISYGMHVMCCGRMYQMSILCKRGETALHRPNFAPTKHYKMQYDKGITTLFTISQWRHNQCDGTPNHWHLDCLLNCLFRRRSKKTSTLLATALFEGNPPVTGGFPSQRTSDTENVSIWLRHHEQHTNSACFRVSVAYLPCCALF